MGPLSFCPMGRCPFACLYLAIQSEGTIRRSGIASPFERSLSAAQYCP